MGCSESIPLKTSISISTLSTLPTQLKQQKSNEYSFEEIYDDFDTIEKEEAHSSFYYDKIAKSVVTIPKLGPIENSIILKRRKSCSIN